MILFPVKKCSNLWKWIFNKLLKDNLLRYYSHTMQSTQLKRTIQWCLVSCATIATVNPGYFYNFRKKPTLISNQSHFTPLTSPRTFWSVFIYHEFSCSKLFGVIMESLIRGLLCLDFFTRCTVFRVHRCCVYQYFVLRVK